MYIYIRIFSAVAILVSITLIADLTQVCEKNRVNLQILGSGGPELNDGRASSSYLVWLDKKAAILVDAGSGSSFNFERSGAKIDDLKAMLFTHYHVDHSADFPAYVKGSFFTSRDEDLLIYGPDGNDVMPSTTQFVNEVLGENGVYKYLLGANYYLSGDWQLIQTPAAGFPSEFVEAGDIVRSAR